jgi:hypothetical protein
VANNITYSCQKVLCHFRTSREVDLENIIELGKLQREIGRSYRSRSGVRLIFNSALLDSSLCRIQGSEELHAFRRRREWAGLRQLFSVQISRHQTWD